MTDKKNYQYIARTPQGKKVSGDMQANGKLEVSQYLQQQQLMPISIDEVTPFFSLNYLRNINIGGIPLRDKVFFMRQFATMVSAGLPLTKSLEILHIQTVNPRFRKILKNVLEDVSTGKTLADSFGKYTDAFDKITINLIRAGEKSGKLENILKRLAQEYEDRKKLSSKLQSAMIYPVVISIVMVAVVFLIMVFMIPTMAEIYDGFDSKLPFITQILINLSTFLASFWYIIIATVIISYVAFTSYIKSGPGQQIWHRVLLKLPIFGVLITKTQVAAFSRILFLLTHGGMPILEALDLVKDSLSNYWFRQAIIKARQDVEQGRPLAISFLQADIFPVTVGYMINVGEQTGELDQILEKLASYYDMEVEIATEGLTSIIEPVMIVVMGGVIAFIAVAIYLPMFQLTQLIQ